MGKYGLLDLEKHFAFYGAYHSNPINIIIHMIFVWPIFFTVLLLLYFTPLLFGLPSIQFPLLGIHVVLLINFGFLIALLYALFYICLDFKAGSLAAFLCAFCWVGSSVVANWLGFDLAWKSLLFVASLICVGMAESMASVNTWSFISVVLVAQIVCWTGQFIGHGVYERRAPALLDNLIQAFVMAPFFVLLEALQICFGYEPYPGFHANVQARITTEISEWQEKQKKLLS